MMNLRYFLVILILKTFVFLTSGRAQVVVINEVCTSPPGSSSVNANSLYNTDPNEQPPDNQEWIELYNPHPCNSVDISCFTLASNMQQNGLSGSIPNWGAFTFPAGTVIPPLGFIIIGGNHSQVPVLDFNLTYYRQNFYGIQYLDGDYTRWFLRDEYGWVAIYDAAGVVVDAVYWDAYGNAGNLFTAGEYSQNVVTTTTCSGTQSLTAARYIAGIEFLGACQPETYLSFQRVIDGSSTWHTGPISPSPGACNGPCVGPPQLSFTQQDESCAGNDGSINMTIIDGHTGPYTINWINPAGVHTGSLTNLTGGTYIVQVVDAYNCYILYDTIIITTMPDPSINFSVINNETCGLGNGFVQTSVSNGNTPVNYNWSNGATTSGISGVPAGNYSVSITDNLGCTASNSLTLINLPGPQLSLDSITNEMCSGSDGNIFVDITGGSQPFSYAWNSNPPQNTLNLQQVHAGSYSLTVTDANNCTATLQAVITNTEPPAIIFSDISPDTCNKKIGSVEALATGGHPPYNFSWSTGSSGLAISNLFSGSYSLSVTDSFCTSVASVYVPNIPGPKAGFVFYPPVATIDNPVFRFENQSTGLINHWFWDFGDFHTDITKNPVHTYQDTGVYNVMLKISNNAGCIDSVIKQAVVVNIPAIYIPNSFTPNGDGTNDFFFVQSTNISEMNLFLYNRWGELVCHLKNPGDKWDGRYHGKVIPAGVYSYIVYFTENYGGIRQMEQYKTGMLVVFL